MKSRKGLSFSAIEGGRQLFTIHLAQAISKFFFDDGWSLVTAVAWIGYILLVLVGCGVWPRTWPIDTCGNGRQINSERIVEASKLSV